MGKQLTCDLYMKLDLDIFCNMSKLPPPPPPPKKISVW